MPNVTADIQIVPGKEEATSDLVVSWQERRPVRLSLGLDDSGSKSTGRYLGSATLSIDAPFAQNDLFYTNISKDFFDNGPFGNRSYTFNYVIPVGYWSFSANYNHYTYHQNIPNANEVLRYSGESDNTQFTVSRLLFRNQFHKTTLNMRVYRKHSNEIDIDQQHRRTAQGAQVDSEEGKIAIKAQSVDIQSVSQHLEDQDNERVNSGCKRSERVVETTIETVTGSTFSGKNGVDIAATESDITVTGSTLHSEKGAIDLNAKQNVTLNSATETHSEFLEEHSSSKGFLSSSKYPYHPK